MLSIPNNRSRHQPNLNHRPQIFKDGHTLTSQVK
jgi:hypothetical protein